MSIKVCDALCGSGKTSACIRMMNEEKDKRFIFVTQFLSEASRIVKSCASRGFVMPVTEQDDTGRKVRKIDDIKDLLKNKQNIATTHSLFTSFTDEIKTLITNGGYSLVLDETVDVVLTTDVKKCDIDLLSRVNAIEEEDGLIKWIDEDYEKNNENGDGIFNETIRLSKSKNLLTYDGKIFCWSLPSDLFSCFEDVYVLTYLFRAQVLRCFFDLYGKEYEYIGVKQKDGEYVFCPPEEMDRKRDLRDKIHILEHKKLNAVGSARSALSYSAYHNANSSITRDRMRRNLGNLFKNIYHAPSEQILWTVFKEAREDVSGKGYKLGFVPYNKRASNDYANRHYLAYCVNNFFRPWEFKMYSQKGVNIDNDMYGLSFLIQWMFRSAIRKGEEIWIYVPSARMRSLLKQWLDKLAEGKDLEPVSYTSPRKSYYVKNGKRKSPDVHCSKIKKKRKEITANGREKM